jgi:hypothetical protein
MLMLSDVQNETANQKQRNDINIKAAILLEVKKPEICAKTKDSLRSYNYPSIEQVLVVLAGHSPTPPSPSFECRAEEDHT